MKLLARGYAAAHSRELARTSVSNIIVSSADGIRRYGKSSALDRSKVRKCRTLGNVEDSRYIETYSCGVLGIDALGCLAKLILMFTKVYDSKNIRFSIPTFANMI